MSECKLTELNYAQGLMEAEMEAGRAYVSLSVLKQANGAGRVKGTSSIVKREKEPAALELIGHEENVVEQTDVNLEMKCPNTSPEPASSEPILKLPIAEVSEQPVARPQENIITLSEIERECELPLPTQSIQRQERSEQVQMELPRDPDLYQRVQMEVTPKSSITNVRKVERFT